ncbi:MAG TPA: hypothetical protein VD998_00250 [Verrucomicrobiae bacterium]|nr:hypothetical protein [Verrucomicrobiae bacterium]
MQSNSDLDLAEKKRSQIERVLKSVDARKKHATEAFLESNRFEFDVCKLLLQGTAGAFFLYVAGAGYLSKPGGSVTLNLIPLFAWGLSLLAGIAHMLQWAHRLQSLGENEMKTAAQILKDLTESKEQPEKILTGVATEELEYHKKKGFKNKLKQENFKYIALRESYDYVLIFSQLFLLILGCVAALNLGYPIIHYW